MASSDDMIMDSLQEWKRRLSPLRVDIVGDFAGKELFTIHGESLVAHCLASANVDYLEGFQLLHAVHAIEVFLAKLKERGCNFHVLWFDSHRDLATPPDSPKNTSYKYLLTRAVIIEHLRCPEPHPKMSFDDRGINSPMSFVFPSIMSPEFVEYTNQHRFHFVMMSQGRSSDFDTTSEGEFLRIMYLFGLRGYSLAFIDDIEFRSSKAYTLIATAPTSVTVIPVTEPTPATKPDPSYRRTIERLQAIAKPSEWRGIRSDGEVEAQEEVAVTFCAVFLSDKAFSDVHSHRLVAAFLSHIALLKHATLLQRPVETPPKLEKFSGIEEFLATFAEVAVHLIQQWPREKEGQYLNWRVCDLIDGRIYSQVLERLETLKLPSDAGSWYAEAVRLLSGVDVSYCMPDFVLHIKSGAGIHRISYQPPDIQSILAFSHPVLDKYLEDVKLTSQCVMEDETSESKIFQELSHWHNSKKSIDPKHVPKRRGFYASKRNQRYMADTIAYSASLTNSTGKSIDPETIVAKKRDLSAESRKQVGTTRRQDHSIKSGTENALETSRRLREAKSQSRTAVIIKNWEEKCQDFDKITSVFQRYLRVKRYLSSLSSEDQKSIGGEVMLYMCNILGLQLIRRPSKKAFSDSETSMLAMIWAQVREMMSLPLSVETKQQVQYLMKALKFPLGELRSGPFVLVKHRLPFVSTYEVSTTHLRIQTTGLEFQLAHCGPYLERSFDSAPDPRVPFSPDAWQRKVLDAIDDDKSLFVVAPTSAGKTFISFYAMKKILQNSDDDVLVYVAPTKALVNQIAAEVQARFSKSYRHEGRSVWAIHTRDYRVNNPTSCQVLVTVPHILQIMLLAPNNAQNERSWARRVKRIIFDEVHCIGQAEDGIIWEQLLLLAPCPMIALSATVGNPLEFKEWLAGTQKAKGFDLEMIVHSARYSDLRKFLYQPPTRLKFEGLEPVERLPIPGLDAEAGETSRFTFVHPIGSIINKNRETLDDASLEPRDCLRLWLSMKESENESYLISPSLEPKNALPELVKKSDIIKWEAALKAQLWQWQQDPKSPFPEVYKRLKINRPSSVIDLERPEVVADIYGDSSFSLLVDLRSRGALPAILFNYDRLGCERVIFKLLQVLEDAEQEHRDTSTEWARKMDAYQKWRQATDSKAAKKRAKATRATGAANSKEERHDAKDAGTSLNQADLVREDAGRETSPWENFDPEAPLPQYNFADTTKLTAEELEARIRSLDDLRIKPRLIDALRRGLGVHHAGMNRQYRQVVEMLFRKGYLTVIVATGTLALGLNMPCKTVVFIGDSAFLTALNYRQASGRAGRRGFDLLGNVVFHGIPHHRAMEIISSRLPDLRGQFPISVTLVLRLFTLLHSTNNSQYAIDAVESLLTQTRLFLGGPASQMTVKHHLRFSIEYLRRQHLLSRKGAPLNFSGLVGHLYFTENAVFALHSLLKEGYLHKLCEDFSNPRKQGEIILTLLTVLCHLFCRIPCSKYNNRVWLENVVHRSPSVVLLPRLPGEAETVLRGHNEETLKIFKTYVRSFIAQNLQDSPDNQLPFTKRRVGAVGEASADISTAQIPTLPFPVLRSPFAALSGFTDDFATIHELCDTVRAGVFLDESAVPYIPIYPEETNGVPWNAYIYDFYKHGDLNTLVQDNGIKGGDVWFHLKDFSLILATIVTSLENIMGRVDADDSDMINVQDVADTIEEERFGEEFDAQYSENHVALSVTAKAKTKSHSGKSKEAVAESWEDVSDGSSSDTAHASSSASRTGQATESEGKSFGSAREKGGGDSLVKVHMAFKLLQQVFEDKFRKVWS
ncbi:DEAD/DEAH box helicase [Colletotrichum scovillei]|uniref:DEAD/DEAH box helicase n=1 Tax=Colletotrichum scovillei TaxID=1209932 RepID=UPI0015C3B6D2|nr:DEAD/DEAH box helicase [Colletotrichum scovillei]KAF4777168.1 DEAD/DEAH box helicase [Colletotrichum scovillei]KAG7079997.1 DEAD-like helicase [Colletotrichum scovillei]